MSFSARLALFALSALLLSAQERSALEREPQGWTEITPGPNFARWTQLAISPDQDDPIPQWSIFPGGVVLREGGGYFFGYTVVDGAQGATISEYKYRPVEKSHPGPEAEGFRLEFRNLKVKPLPSASLQ
jgi:hypothetical protein